jgi:hypothetical protein
MGTAKALLDDYMKAIKAAIVDYATRDDRRNQACLVDEGGGGASVPATGNHIFDKHNTRVLVNDRSAQTLIDSSPALLSPLEIALAPHLLGIMKHLSSCLQLAGVTGHPAGGSVEAFGESTARFEHDRPDGLEGMSGSCRAEMWRCLHICIVFSRKGCFTNPHQDQLSTDSCIVLLALHARTGGVGQWRITLLDPSYLGKRANTATADRGRAGAGAGDC